MASTAEGRVAVIGAGPGGLVAAKHALDAGLDVSVFEATGDVGGQWQSTAPHSGIWPGMHTNTSRALTAFSDLPAPADHPLHPAATQVHAYLRAYADRFGLTPRIRMNTRVTRLGRSKGGGWDVDGEPFDGVVLASGRFRRPRMPPGLQGFTGELLHAFDYPGAAALSDRRVLVYGNGVSGLEIAGDLVGSADVTSAFRKPRYVLDKVTEGVSSDWRWYTYFGALQRRALDPEDFADRLRAQVIRRAGDPADFGAPAPDPDIRVAGTSLSQGYLAAVAARDITCRPHITAVDGDRITFADGTAERFDTVVAATGYSLDLPYVDDELRAVLAPEPALFRQTFHPDLPGLGVIGQFLLQGPYFPLLELQARWIVAVLAGQADLPEPAQMREVMKTPRPPVEAHNALAVMLAESSGVAPDLLARPALTNGLIFGPMLPLRYRLDGPGALPGAADGFLEQLAASPRDPVEAADLQLLRELGLTAEADVVLSNS